MKCNICGSELPDNADFCTNCGHRIINKSLRPIRCRKCGAKIPENAKYCPDCGLDLSIEKTCPHCGIELKQDSFRCPKCGNIIGY